MQSQKQPLLASTAQAFSIFLHQNETVIDLTRWKWWVEKKMKSHLMELAKQLISFKVKMVCFSQRNVDGGSCFHWLREKRFPSKCFRLEKKKFWNDYVTYGLVRKVENSRFWYRQHNHFPLSSPKRKRHWLDKGKNGEFTGKYKVKSHLM